jgi:ABC-2 type transport system ATP-binding protein
VQLDADPVALTARVNGHGTEQGAAEQAARALAELARSGITVDNFALGQPSLDEVFLALTDKKGTAA